MMVISGDFTSIVAGVTQPKVENRKPQQSDQSSQTQFDDVLNKNKNDNLTASRDSDKQAAKADSDKKYSDKIANDKTANDRALDNKAASGTAFGNDQAASDNAEMAVAAENEMSTKGHDGKKEGKLKSSSQEEKDSDDSAASSINQYLSQLNSSKESVAKDGKLTARNEGNIRETKTDENAGDNISRKQTSGRRVHNGANQQASTNQQSNFNTAADKLEAAPTLNIGDKVAVTGNGTEKSDALGRIADVEVTENRKVGDMRVLRIKLNPESLGMVEARLRKTSEGLKIEIHAERQETARLLVADRHMLTKALEKSGFNDDGRLTIMVVDRSSQTVQQGQASNSGQQTPQDNSGQNFNGQRQFTGQQGQGEHNGSRQTFTEFPFTGTPLQEESVGEQTAYRDPRRLVV